MIRITKRYNKSLFFFAASMLISFSGISQPSFVKDSLYSYIFQGMKDWQIPGLAMVIVKDGKVVVMKGFGTKEMGKNDPVDENTLFMIASNTKLFTGTALAKLDFEGKLSLNDRITKYMPDYKLFDSNVTRMVTIRDLLSHRIGTKTFQGDFTFWNTNLSRKEIITRMRLLRPVAQYRQEYGYCNSCFLTAGEIIPIVTGSSWENYITDNFLKPLGMTNSYALSEGYEKRANIAKPYTNAFGPLALLRYDNMDALAPAASIISNVKDISKWLLMQLDSGRLEGKRILPWNVIRSTRDMITSIGSRKSTVYPIHFRGYGLGLVMNDYNGRAVYSHTGGADGFVTNTCFVPEEKLGIAIFTNNDNQNFFESLRYQILDAYLGVPYTNRSKNDLKNQRAAEKETMDSIQSLDRRVDTKQKPLIAIQEFTGDYHNPVYGKINIRRQETGDREQGDIRLVISFENHPWLTARLDYMDNNEFKTTYSHPGYGIFPAKFVIENGNVRSVELKVNDFIEIDPYIFTKE